MQIRGDYISYSNNAYDHKHTHHITKCLHEEQSKQQEAAASGMKSETLSMQNAREEVKQEPAGLYEDVKKLTGESKKRTGFFKKIWDAMGEDAPESSPKVPLSEYRHNFGVRAMTAVSAALKHMIPYGMINRLEDVRVKVRTVAKSVLRRLGKKEEAFTALTDPGEHFTGKKDADKKFHENRGKGTRSKAGVILTSSVPDSHLMDSYSKTGAYCRLNENLTYQKEGTAARRVKEPAKDE